MELSKVDTKDYERVIRTTVMTLYSKEETEELLEGILYELEDGSSLYLITAEGIEAGFLVVTPLSDNDDNENGVDILSIEDIFIKTDMQTKNIGDALCIEIKRLVKDLDVPQVEVIVSQTISWINSSLIENGYISSEVKLEKILPRSNNLQDVLELIQDCTPIDRIVQVLMERDEEFLAEFVEEVEEIESLILDGWIPIMVVVTFEPDSSEIKQIIEESNQLINWDDYSVVYNL